MTQLFKNKYRIASARLPGWDYSRPGLYFITICCKNRERWFGRIAERKMILSGPGKIAQGIMGKIPEYFEHVRLNQFIVMPDHVHVVLILDDRLRTETGRNDQRTVQDKNNAPVYKNAVRGGITGDKNPMLEKNSIGRIIRWYKSRVSYEIHLKYPDDYFQWQSRYYDRIIRDENGLYRIKKYIYNNPLNWKDIYNDL
jgi:putative transposase